MLRFVWVFSIAVVGLLAGCVHYQPRPLNSERQLERFEQRSLAAPGLRAYLETNLHREFPTWPPASWELESLTFAAFYFQPALDTARAKWASAQAGQVTAGQRPNPVLSASPAYNTTTTIPSPWVVPASLDIPIETAGKRGYRLMETQHLSAAARLGIATAAWDVRTRLRQALVELWSAEQTDALLQKQLAAQQEIVRLLEAALAGGAVSQAEVTRERILAEQARLLIVDVQGRRVQARISLADAIGLPASGLKGVAIKWDFFNQAPGELPPTEARRRALLNRADVLAGLSDYAASEAALRLEIAKQYPDVHLNPGYEFDQGDHKWGLGASVELPVLNQNRGPIRQAEARRQELAAAFNALQARVLGEIESAIAGLEAARKKLAAANVLMEQVGLRERQNQAMFEAGEVSRQALAAAQLERATAAVLQLEAQSKVQTALGQLESVLQTPMEMPSALFDITPPPAAPRKK